jgi:hypothetical protein
MMITEEQNEKTTKEELSNDQSTSREHRKKSKKLTPAESNCHQEEIPPSIAFEQGNRNDGEHDEKAKDHSHVRKVKRKAKTESVFHADLRLIVKKQCRDKEKINECHKSNLNVATLDTFSTDDKNHQSHAKKENIASTEEYDDSSNMNVISEQKSTALKFKVQEGKQSVGSRSANDAKFPPVSHRLAFDEETRGQKVKNNQSSNLLQEDFTEEGSQKEDKQSLPTMSSIEDSSNVSPPLQLPSSSPGLQLLHSGPYLLHPVPPFPNPFRLSLPSNFLPFAGHYPSEQATHHASALNIEVAQRIGHLIALNPLFSQSMLWQMMNLIPNSAPSRPVPFGFPYGPMYLPSWPNVIPASSLPVTANLNQNQDPNSMTNRVQTSQSSNSRDEDYPESRHKQSCGIKDSTNVSGANSEKNNDLRTEIPMPILQSCITHESIGPDVPECLPAVLALPKDEVKLSTFQYLLRQQIEAFKATENDIVTHARGRNKPITLDQVGIRCRHCASCPLSQRKKGAVYFPFTLLGVYQAAQNMATSHFIQGNCAEIPSETTAKLVESVASKSVVGSGKEFWAKSGRTLGLIDTDQGIRFIRDLVTASNESKRVQ